YTLVSDYGPGHDAEAAFTEAFKAAGGQLVGSVRVPLQNPDFAPYMQRVKDAKPDALMVFIPAGNTATSVMKTFADLGLASASSSRSARSTSSSTGQIPTGRVARSRWSRRRATSCRTSTCAKCAR